MKEENVLKEMHRIVAGDHMVFLYDDEKDISNISILVTYIILRLEKSEKCFYIEGDFDTNLILSNLREYINIDDAILNGQLSIVDKKDAYSKSGKFSPSKMIELLKELTSLAIRDGFKAFSISGELSWVLDDENGFDKIMEYEHLLNNEIFSNYPVSAICRYNINKFSSQMIQHIIEVHPIIIWKNQIHENPFYNEVNEDTSIDIDRYHVNSMLSTIENFTYTKTRFKNEIKDKEKKYQELQLSVLEDIVVTLTSILEIHDVYTKNHSQNVANLSRQIAIKMGLDDSDIIQIYYAGLVHDIGKTLIPKEIITKTGKLTYEEYEIVKKHPSHAYDVLNNSPELKDIANIVLQHHERWDGKGYPNCIQGESISLAARIIAIADTYDAMTSDRPYRKAFDKEFALNEIKNNAGTQFDPNIAILAAEEVFLP
ncbi:MAG: MEDS domain-containing protein [Sphaerochaetaceae bacterium]|nr:MEDS domain-containing protein [Sphaerochaetaceae bacterium]